MIDSGAGAIELKVLERRVAIDFGGPWSTWSRFQLISIMSIYHFLVCSIQENYRIAAYVRYCFTGQL